jgi:hypothetical protein
MGDKLLKWKRKFKCENLNLRQMIKMSCVFFFFYNITSGIQAGLFILNWI